MNRRRIAVTGLGALSALGATVAENWDAAVSGRGGIAVHTLDASRHGPAPHTLPLARVEGDVAALVDARTGQTLGAALDPFAAMALAVCAEALDQAGLTGHPVLEERTAVILGHAMGGMATLETGYERIYGQRQPRLHPMTVPRIMLSAGASAAAVAFGVRGPVFAVSSACASSSHAILQAAGMIRSGEADVAIAGGPRPSPRPAACGPGRPSTPCRRAAAARSARIATA